MTTLDRCSFCAGTSFTAHSTARYWTEIPLRFVACDNCGLVFANPMPDLDLIVEGNRALSILHPTRGTFSQYRGGKEFTLQLARVRRSGVMLDVGCAQGFFLKGVEENSAWRAEGLDVLGDAITFARARLGLTVHEGTLETLAGAEGRYHMIRMNNVIEHVENPAAFLRAARALLAPGGRVHCSTPNGLQDGALMRVANRRGFEMNLLENHFHLFPPRTLRALFESAGFRVTRHYLEDISHTLSDHGVTPGVRAPEENPAHVLTTQRGVPVPEFVIGDDELQGYRNRPSIAWWRIRSSRLIRRWTTLRLPVQFRIGHQQYLDAVAVP